MKRRKFLGTTLAGIPIVTATATAAATDFGTPASLNSGILPVPMDGRLTLPLDETGITPSLRAVTRSVMSLFGTAISDPDVAQTIASDPELALKHYGLTGLITSDDPLLQAAKLVSDADLQQLMAEADYKTFMHELKARGYLVPLRKSKLRQHYVKLLSNDQKSFTKYLKNIFDKNPASLTDTQKRSERVNRIIDLMHPGGGVATPTLVDNGGGYYDDPWFGGGGGGGGGGYYDPGYGGGGGGYYDPGYGGGGGGYDPGYGVAAVVSVVYIAVAAYVYVIAASQAAVGLNVAVVVTAWTKLAVWGDSNIPRVGTQAMNAEDANAQVQDSLRNLQRTAMAASIYGRKDLVLEAFKTEVDRELVAMLEAAEEIGMIKFPKGKRREIFAEMKKLCHEAVGLGA